MTSLMNNMSRICKILLSFVSIVIQISDNEEGPHVLPKIASDDKPALDSQVKVDNTESTPRYVMSFS